MLTYDFEHIDGPIYEYLYKCIKADILSGKLKPDEKLPSKRMFANNNGISTITIQNAYDQLISEGYVYTLKRKGYYVAKMEGVMRPMSAKEVHYDIELPKSEDVEYDFSSNGINSDNFPFTVWTRLSREVMSIRKDDLMTISPSTGVRELREAIAEHLKSFRGMLVDPNQIVVGAGTEYLYGLVIQLLGKDKSFAIENPGYRKLTWIYKQRDVACWFVSLDENGMTVEGLEESGADVAHICPNHHFPTGITMPAGRRREILSWANGKEGRYIIEDDYDSEFRLERKPIPTLFSVDACEKVIYMNTFSKSLTPTIRISYMILPVHLANRFYKEMFFYACTVSNFEQYTLAQFISRGYFEKHINRMRLYYIRRRKKIVEVIRNSDLGDGCRIIENDSGLHFLIQLDTELPDLVVEEQLQKKGVKIRALSDYYFTKENVRQHCFIVNYSNLGEEEVRMVMELMKEMIRE
uniref:MocR-like pyridoxine biosynthesis transcription factor PdxR n=1 Tax=Eubacterium cellulosolvens TaxID=29322 RepID=UPI000488AE93|nr:PLP-dependent aminotransferase family protein [[Eubacterium] cellulosolvens]